MSRTSGIKNITDDAATPLEILQTVGNLLGLNCNRDINTLPNALGYDAEILEQLQAASEPLFIRLVNFGSNFHIYAPDPQSSLLIACMLHRYVRMQSCNVQSQFARAEKQACAEAATNGGREQS